MSSIKKTENLNKDITRLITRALEVWSQYTDRSVIHAIIKTLDYLVDSVETLGKEYSLSGTSKKNIVLEVLEGVIDAYRFRVGYGIFKFIPDKWMKSIIKKIIMSGASVIIDYIVSLINKLTAKDETE